MIRVIKTDNQIIDGVKGFSLYDTVVDKFVTVDGEQNWETADELAQCFEYVISVMMRGPLKYGHSVTDEMSFRDRCVGLARGSGY